MTNKRIIVIVAAIIILFLGILSFATGGNDNEGKDNNDNQNIIDEEKDDEVKEEEEGGQEEQSQTNRTNADLTAPVIVLNGDAEIYLELGEKYTELNAKVTDNVDADKDAVVTGSVDVTKTGIYTLTYNATDAAGNTATPVTRTVKVRPLISGITSYTHEVGDAAPTLTMSVTTEEGGTPISVNPSNTITWNVVGGPYELKFNYTTADGVKATEKVIEVTVDDTNTPYVFFTRNGNRFYEQDTRTYLVVKDKGNLDTESLKYLWLPEFEGTPSETDFTESFDNYGRIKTPFVTGKYRLWILATDSKGNTMIDHSRIFYLDNSRPSTPLVNFKGTSERCKWRNTDITIDLTSFDFGSGFVKYQYKAGHSNWKNVFPYGDDEITVSGDYVNEMYKFRAVDGVGLRSSSTRNYCVKIDKIDPVIEFTEDAERTNWKNNHTVRAEIKDLESGLDNIKYAWLKENVDIDITDIDNTITSMSGDYAFISGDNTMNGTYYLWIRAVDEAGNSKTMVSSGYNFDNDLPEIDSVSKTPDRVWSDTDVVLTINASDDTSSIIKYLYSINDGTLIDNGTSNQITIYSTSTVKIYVKDSANNTSVAYPVMVNIDRNDPTIDVVDAYKPNSETSRINVRKSNYSDSDMLGFVNANDTGGSGINTITYNGSNSGYNFNAFGPVTIPYVVTDFSGRTASVNVFFNVRDVEITQISNTDYYAYVPWENLFGNTYIGKKLSVSVYAGGYGDVYTINYYWKKTGTGAPTDLEWLTSILWTQCSNPVTINQDFVYNEYGIIDWDAKYLDGDSGSKNWTLWVKVNGQDVSYKDFVVEQ